MMELTIQQLKDMKSGKIFLTGTGIFPELIDKEIKWAAVRGEGYHDWCIYYQYPYRSAEYVANHGDKIFTETIIKRLVPCDKASFEMYRY